LIIADDNHMSLSKDCRRYQVISNVEENEKLAIINYYWPEGWQQ
jgi:hypothetical protein